MGDVGVGDLGAAVGDLDQNGIGAVLALIGAVFKVGSRTVLEAESTGAGVDLEESAVAATDDAVDEGCTLAVGIGGSGVVGSREGTAFSGGGDHPLVFVDDAAAGGVEVGEVFPNVFHTDGEGAGGFGAIGGDGLDGDGVLGAVDTIAGLGLIVEVDQAAVRNRDHTCGGVDGEATAGVVGEAVGDGIGGAIGIGGVGGDAHEGAVGGVFTHGAVVGAVITCTDLRWGWIAIAASNGTAIAVGGIEEGDIEFIDVGDADAQGLDGREAAQIRDLNSEIKGGLAAGEQAFKIGSLLEGQHACVGVDGEEARCCSKGGFTAGFDGEGEGVAEIRIAGGDGGDRCAVLCNGEVALCGCDAGSFVDISDGEAELA